MHILAHSYTLNVCSHDDTQKILYRNCRLLSDTVDLANSLSRSCYGFTLVSNHDRLPPTHVYIMVLHWFSSTGYPTPTGGSALVSNRRFLDQLPHTQTEMNDCRFELLTVGAMHRRPGEVNGKYQRYLTPAFLMEDKLFGWQRESARLQHRLSHRACCC